MFNYYHLTCACACVYRYSAASSAAQSSAFTRSLHRTRSLLSDEISRSSSALSTLSSSTRVLGDTGSELVRYDGTLRVGSKLITKQLQRERTDKILILVGLCFFTLVVLYIINKRLTPFLFWWTTIFASSKANIQRTPQATYHQSSPSHLPPLPSQLPDITATAPVNPIPIRTPTPEPITPQQIRTEAATMNERVKTEEATAASRQPAPTQQPLSPSPQPADPALVTIQIDATPPINNQFGFINAETNQKEEIQHPAAKIPLGIHAYDEPPLGAHHQHHHHGEHDHDHAHHDHHHHHP